MPSEISKEWDGAHVSYGICGGGPGGELERDDYDWDWRSKMINQAPNGKLILENSMFDSLKDSSKVYLTHITQNLDVILERGAIYPSGGCLLGSVYASPLFKEGSSFRMHNLGRYVFEKEAPRASRLRGNSNVPTLLIIEVSMPKNKTNHLIGIDYTRLGHIHLSTYQKLESALSRSQRDELSKAVSEKVVSAIDFLCLVNTSHVAHKPIEPKVFFDLLVKNINHLPILGYLYFEAVSEYLMLYQTSEEAEVAHAYKELYNHSYKNLVFDLFPALPISGGLSIFKPTLQELSTYIERKGLIPQLTKREISVHLVARLTSLICSRLLRDVSFSKNPSTLRWDFDSSAEMFPLLLGYMVRDELKKIHRRYNFDELEATQVWDYWNDMNVLIPFNGFIPKGEVGINPTHPDLKYQIFLGRPVKNRDGLRVVLERSLSIKIIPKLIEEKYVNMRI